MGQPPSIETPENWDAASSGYAEHIAKRLMTQYAGAFIERLHVDERMEVLEVAAGSGALTASLAGRVGSLLATDFAPKMIELVRRRLQELGATNVTFEVMDGQALDLEDDRFDRVVSSFGVMLFPDRPRGFSEMARVLKPGGKALVSAWAGPDRFEIFGLFLGALKRAFPDLPPPPNPPPVFSLSEPAAFKAEMEAAGFRDVEVGYETRELENTGSEEVWTMLTSGAPPVKMLLDRIGLEGQAKLRDSLETLVSERFGEGPVRTSNTATVGTGVAP